MAFAYVVPLSAFQSLFNDVIPGLRHELAERLRAEIHADVARRLIGPGTYTAMGRLDTAFDSVVSGSDIVFFSHLDFEAAARATGDPRSSLFIGPRPAPQPQTLRQLMDRRWRYPGDGGNGVFASSVNAVAARAHVLRDEFRARAREVG